MGLNKIIHPGVYIGQNIIKTIAEKLEISSDDVFSLFKGEIDITPQMAEKLPRIFPTTTDQDWLFAQSRYEQSLRVLEEAEDCIKA